MAFIKKRVNKDWTWFEDYVYISATYGCFTPPGRRVQVGMGVFAGGEPRGEKVAVSGKGQFTVLGAGSVHIRVYDDGGDCEIAISQDSNTPIPILKASF